MASVTTCPETVDLYDHLEGAISLDEHLSGCERCRASLADLRHALDVEARAFAPPSELEVERALQNVRARGRARVRRPWGQTALAFAAASVTLALLLPSAFENPDPCRPVSVPAGVGAVNGPANNVDAPAGFVGETPHTSLVGIVGLDSSAAIVGTATRAGR